MTTPARPKPLDLAIVGAGRIAQSYVDVVAAVSCVNVVAVADVDEPAAARLARKFGDARSFSSHEALLSSFEPDGVLIASPPATHGPIALDFLERGVPVFCEKPLAVDTETASAMIQAAQKTGVVLTMAAKFRFADDVTRARHIVESGILGELMLFENAFTSRVDMSGRWNADPRIAGGGVLIDNGTHSVDIARFFLGPIGQVMAVEGKRTQQLEVEDTVRVFLRSTSEVIGSIDLSWSMDKSLDDYISIFGTEGEIRVGWRRSSFRQTGNTDWVSFGKGYDKIEAMGGAVENFIHAVRGEEPLLITAEDALASVAVIEQAYASLAADHWVPVPASIGKVPASASVVAALREPSLMARVHSTALVENGVDLGDGTAVWDNAHLRGPSTIGRDCIIGEKTHVAYGVCIGDRVKINAFVYICTGVTLEDGVMVSAGTVFTNDRYPRATTPDLGSLRPSDPDEDTTTTRVGAGATIGARAVIGPGVDLGRFSMVAAGAVVTRDVADFHLVAGLPARSIGVVCRCGPPVLRVAPGAHLPDHDELRCDSCGRRFAVTSGRVKELDP